ncbi:MAG: hypothetical protein JW818_02685 [Pirellulales bacterium]|nr:hypothetical protein [Pirellulales bacterium]
MVATVLVLATATLGVDVGWEPTSDGKLEYIIQIPPEQLKSFREGNPIRSVIRPELRGVRSYRIQVGTGPLPQKGQPPAPEAPAKPDTAQETRLKMAPLFQPGAEKDPSSASAPPQAPSPGDSPPEAPSPVDSPPKVSAPTESAAKSAEPAPEPLAPEAVANSKALPEKPATYNQPLGDSSNHHSDEQDDASKHPSYNINIAMWSAGGTFVGLLAALIYLGWIHLGTRAQYRALLARHMVLGPAPSEHIPSEQWT